MFCAGILYITFFLSRGGDGNRRGTLRPAAVYERELDGSCRFEVGC